MTIGPKYQIEAESTDGLRLVTATGEIDMASAAELEEVLAGESDEVVVANLSDVGFIDSSGLRALLAARDKLEDAGGRLVLVFGDGPVERIIDLTGLADRFEVFETVTAATEAVG